MFQNLTNLENILSILSRNIATVNLFHFIKFNDIEVYFKNFEFLPVEKISTFSTYANIYYETNLGYLLTINLLILLFCYLFTKKILVIND